MKSTDNNRLGFIDWTRGVATLIMLQGHVFHSFTSTELRESGPYIISQFVGGMPPAVFLFLTGVTLAFLMDGGERKGLSTSTRLQAALQRAGYLLGIAFLFRLQLWSFAWGQSPFTDLLRVDILNCMGVAIAVLAVMSLFTTRERVRLCAILGVAIACAAPLVSQLDWSGVPATVKQYIAPDLAAFGFFPWAAFLAFGMSAGSILRLAQREEMHRVMQWSAIMGFALVLAGQYFGNLPYSLYRNSDFWLNSPALVFIKLGAILLGLCFAYLWTTYAAPQGWSWVRQLGTTSLLVYWLHTELVYGRWLGFWKEKLSIGQAAVLAVVIIAVMLGLSFIKTLLRNWRQSTGPMAYPAPEVPRVSGD